VSATNSRFKVSIVAPTCFYYQAALFRELAAHPKIDLTVYFCSDEGHFSQDVWEMYKVDEQWGGSEELLEGYRSILLRNYAPRPSYLKWPFGLINVGVIKEIILGRPDAVILMSWMNPTWWMALTVCVLFRLPFLYMTDANVQIEPLRSNRKRRIKRMILGNVLFRLCSGFLCAGTANRQFYKLYGVPDKKLFPFAYSWGYNQLFKVSADLRSQRSQIRGECGIPEQGLVILYCGRLSQEKNLFNLVAAYHQVDDERKTLIFVGDGELRQSLQNYVDELGAASVFFFGFQNRDQIAKYYTISDVLILPSIQETWGIVVNEAMCFGLPVIVSQQVGAGTDLVTNGQNGFSVGTDVGSLLCSIRQFTKLSDEERLQMGRKSLDAMREWARRDLAESLVPIIKFVKTQQSGNRAGDSAGE
jgi:glycosyltransferase involved in cell wall biosynthesis